MESKWKDYINLLYRLNGRDSVDTHKIVTYDKFIFFESTLSNTFIERKFCGKVDFLCKTKELTIIASDAFEYEGNILLSGRIRILDHVKQKETTLEFSSLQQVLNTEDFK